VTKPCWDGYEAYGTKIKDGRKVPNCIPTKKAKKTKEIEEDLSSVTNTSNIPVRNVPAAQGKKKLILPTKLKRMEEEIIEAMVQSVCRDMLLESLAQLKRAVKIPANPLFHVTGNAAVQILRGSGLEAQSAGESRFGGTQYDISMTRNLNWALNANRKGFGRTIFVFDGNEIQRKFKREARNYQGYKQQNDNEFEERILTKKIPKQMIKGIIINDEPDWMEKEWAGWPKQFGLKMFVVHYTGGKYKVLTDPRV